MKLAAVLLLTLSGINLAYAESGKARVPDYVIWKEECGSCHVAFPPRFLTADGWTRLMSGLNRHFGVNAVLEPGESKAILRLLQRHAGSGTLYSSTSQRISDTPWFRREHRSISPNEWINPNVGSRSNCSACHGKNVLGD